MGSSDNTNFISPPTKVDSGAISQLRYRVLFWESSTPVGGPGSDRSNLLGNEFNVENEFNDELIQRAAQLIADSLHGIAIAEDPAAHLDALPRGSGLSEAKYTRGPADRGVSRSLKPGAWSRMERAYSRSRGT